MKRIMFVLSVPTHLDGEGWKSGADGPDLEAVRREIRAQLNEAVPVVCLPENVCLSIIELGEEQEPEISKIIT